MATPTANTFIWDADLVDASTGWVLLPLGCSQPSDMCQYAVARTDDGGHTWANPVNVGPALVQADGDGPRFVRFLNRSDGFVYGHSAAFATHDGGRSWGDAGIPAGEVVAIAGHGPRAWVLSRDCAKGVTCPYTVRSSVDGGRTWIPHQLPASAFSPIDAIPFGTAGLLVSSATDLAVTTDGGSTWSSLPTQCAGNQTFRDFVATADGNEIWQLCTGLVNGVPSDKQLYVTENRGTTWSAVPRQPVGGSLVTLIANAKATAFITTESDPISVTRDLGRTWTQVAPSSGVPSKPWGFMSMRFATTGDAWARDFGQIIWASHDAGATWSQLPAYTAPNK
jgi:photosystem II stability/assembly factor-like uncharacterized protein